MILNAMFDLQGPVQRERKGNQTEIKAKHLEGTTDSEASYRNRNGRVDVRPFHTRQIGTYNRPGPNRRCTKPTLSGTHTQMPSGHGKKGPSLFGSLTLKGDPSQRKGKRWAQRRLAVFMLSPLGKGLGRWSPLRLLFWGEGGDYLQGTSIQHQQGN